MRATKEAKRMAGIRQGDREASLTLSRVVWKPSIVTSEDGNRIYGRFVWSGSYKESEKTGQIIPKEASVYLYMSPSVYSLQPDLFYDILLHELLHYTWLYQSANVSEFQKANPDPHVWIEGLKQWRYQSVH